MMNCQAYCQNICWTEVHTQDQNVIDKPVAREWFLMVWLLFHEEFFSLLVLLVCESIKLDSTESIINFLHVGTPGLPCVPHLHWSGCLWGHLPGYTWRRGYTGLSAQSHSGQQRADWMSGGWWLPIQVTYDGRLVEILSLSVPFNSLNWWYSESSMDLCDCEGCQYSRCVDGR